MKNKNMCDHRKGAIDFDNGAWHCYTCGEYVYDDVSPQIRDRAMWLSFLNGDSSFVL